jgi:DtxR family Mn-dependent transcriptional regulator
MKFTTSEENYLKNIYHLQVMHDKKVSASMLSETVNTRAASVTDMLKKLHKKKLLHYEPYKHFHLTETGNRAAIEIIRKHRLWEFFLVNILKFKWDEVHEIAEELEHVSSTELVIRLEQFLGFPSFDPHGDPIPNSKGKMPEQEQLSLEALPLKQAATVSYIRDQRIAMMDILAHYQIKIGSRLKVIRRFDFDESIEIKVDKQPAATISKQVAANIYCTI